MIIYVCMCGSDGRDASSSSCQHERLNQPHKHKTQHTNPGLVYKVTELFFARGLRVDQLHTDTKIAPFGGTVLFLMDGIICGDRVSLENGWLVVYVDV